MKALSLLALALIASPAFAGDEELECKLSYNFANPINGQKAYPESKVRNFSLVVADTVNGSSNQPAEVRLTKSIDLQVSARKTSDGLWLEFSLDGESQSSGFSTEVQAVSASTLYADADGIYVDGRLLSFDLECESVEDALDQEEVDGEQN